MADRLDKVVKNSFNRLDKVIGQSAGSPLAKYEKLQETDFAQLSAKFGQETVLTYIRDMEREKLKRGDK